MSVFPSVLVRKLLLGFLFCKQIAVPLDIRNTINTGSMFFNSIPNEAVISGGIASAGGPTPVLACKQTSIIKSLSPLQFLYFSPLCIWEGLECVCGAGGEGGRGPEQEWPCLWRPAINLHVIPREPSMLGFETRSLPGTRGLLVWLGWAISNPGICPSLHRQVTLQVAVSTPAFLTVLRIQLCPSCLVGKHFTKELPQLPRCFS